jgi:hypothetical protein
VIEANALAPLSAKLPTPISRELSVKVTLAGTGANRSQSGDDGRMQRFVPVEALFKGRHFDGEIIIRCVSWYTSF